MGSQESPQLDQIAASLHELTALLLSTDEIEEALQHSAELATRTIPGNPECGLMLDRSGQFSTVASTDALTRLIDEAQHAVGDGPCLQAHRTAVPVHVPDIRDEHRWGDYPAIAHGLGVHSVYSQPLTANGDVLGSINLYFMTPGSCTPEARRISELVASQIGLLLSAVLRHADGVTLTAQLRDTLASRSVIDQAIGILIAQHNCTAPAAFAILRTASNQRNVKLNVLAAEIVIATSGHPPARSPFQE